MFRTALAASLAAVVAIPTLAAPASASARSYCEQRAHDRRVGGMILGAVAGGLLGNAVTHGGGRTGGTLIGAAGGAVIGNQIARTSCDRSHAYYRRHYRNGYAYNSGYAYNGPYADQRYYEPPPPPARW
jgi:uncharacterized protein YcfJ